MAFRHRKRSSLWVWLPNELPSQIKMAYVEHTNVVVTSNVFQSIFLVLENLGLVITFSRSNEHFCKKFDQAYNFSAHDSCLITLKAS